MTAAAAQQALTGLAEQVRAVPGVLELHPARPLPIPRALAAEPSVRVRSDHVAIAVGIGVDASVGAHAVAQQVRRVLRSWASRHHPELPPRLTVRVVAVEPVGSIGPAPSALG